MISVFLEGELGDLFTSKLDLAVESVAEVLRALKANFSNFLSYLQDAENRGVRYRIVVGHENITNDKIDKLSCPISKKVRNIRIVPVLAGSGDNWWMWLGAAAMFALAIWVPGGITIFGTKFLTSSTTILLGTILLLAGISSLFKPAKPEEEPTSKSIGGLPNNTQEGGRVPVVYGRIQTGMYVISSRVDSSISGNPLQIRFQNQTSLDPELIGPNSELATLQFLGVPNNSLVTFSLVQGDGDSYNPAFIISGNKLIFNLQGFYTIDDGVIPWTIRVRAVTSGLSPNYDYSQKIEIYWKSTEYA
jgi:predicted phage tail protein